MLKYPDDKIPYASAVRAVPRQNRQRNETSLRRMFTPQLDTIARCLDAKQFRSSG
jgi:hypothetical protein